MTDETEITETGRIDNKLLLSVLRDIRRDQRKTKHLIVSLAKHFGEVEKRLSRRIDEVKDDLEIMLKSEIMGRIANFETRIDQKIEELLIQE